MIPFRRGFTLIEVAVALLLSTIVAAIGHRILSQHRAAARYQLSRLAAEATFRVARAVLREELWGLTVSDSGPTDLAAVGPSSITYDVARTLRFVCRRPDPTTGALTTWNRYHGLRDIDGSVDRAVVMIADSLGSRWVRFDPSSTGVGVCADGSPGVTIGVTGLTADPDLIPDGAPVVGLETVQIRLYRDTRGAWWLGRRRFQRSSGRWPNIQPVVGPFGPGGVEFQFLGANGAITGDERTVRRIRVRLAAPVKSLTLGPDDDVVDERFFDITPRGLRPW